MTIITRAGQAALSSLPPHVRAAAGAVRLATKYGPAAYKAAQVIGRGYRAYKMRKSTNKMKSGKAVTKKAAKKQARVDKTPDNETQPYGTGNKFVKVVARKKNKLVTFVGAPVVFIDTRMSFVDSNPGKQAVADMYAVGTGSQWINSTALPDFYQSRQSYFSLNPSSGAPAGILYAADTVPDDDRFYLYKDDLRIDLANQGTAGCQVWLYFCTPKKGTQMSPSTVWSNSLTAAGLNISGGLADKSDMAAGVPPAVNYPAAGALAITDPYVTPVSRVFKSQYTIQHVHKVLLDSGATEHIRCQLICNQLANRIQLNNDGVTYPKNSVYIMMVVLGDVAKDVTGTPVASLYTYASGRVSYNITSRKVFRQVKTGSNRREIKIGAGGFNTPAEADTRVLPSTGGAPAAPTEN